MRKGNQNKKLTFEDRFDRRYACWVKNVPSAWRFWKRRNRRRYRTLLRHALRKGDEAYI